MRAAQAQPLWPWAVRAGAGPHNEGSEVEAEGPHLVVLGGQQGPGTVEELGCPTSRGPGQRLTGLDQAPSPVTSSGGGIFS